MKRYFGFLIFVLFPIISWGQSSGDYRTISEVVGQWSDVGMWETYNGSSWVAASSYPNNIAHDINIENVEFFEMDVDITIPAGGFIFVDDATVIDLSINSGFTLTNEDDGNIIGEDVVTVYGTYIHDVNGGNIPMFATWDFGSVLEIKGMTSTMPGSIKNQSFKTIDINSSGMTTDFDLSEINFEALDITNTGSASVIVKQTEIYDQDITIESNGVFEISTTGRLTTTGTITNNGSASNFIINANNISSGSLIYNSSLTGTYKQYITEDVWHLIGIPVNKGTGATLGEFDPAGGDGYMRAYETANSNWGDWMTDVNTQLNVGQGYEYWTTVNNTVSLTGTFNTGNVNLTMSSAGNHYNLLSNPYPCAIDWESVSDRTNTVSQAVYYYSNTAGTNGYAVYSGSSHTGTYGATQYIPPFQGFFVEQTSGTSMSFSNSNKADPNTSFYKNDKIDGVSDRVRFQITQDTLWAETVIVNVEDATNNFDFDFDTKMPENAYVIAPEIYSKADDENIMINSIGSYPAVVPLEMDILEPGNITLEVTEMSDMDEYTEVEFEDRVTGNFYPVSDGFQYSFDVVPGILSDRFFVHFSTTVGINENIKDESRIYAHKNVVYIEELGNDADIQIYNMVGQIVYEGSLNANTMHSIELNQPSSYYVVRLISDEINISRKLYIAH